MQSTTVSDVGVGESKVLLGVHAPLTPSPAATGDYVRYCLHSITQLMTSGMHLHLNII